EGGDRPLHLGDARRNGWTGECRRLARREAGDLCDAGRAGEFWRRGDLPVPRIPDLRIARGLVGAKTVPARLREENQWRYDVDELAALITPRTKALILN